MYCIKCKQTTETVNPRIIQRGKRRLQKGGCKLCGTVKHRFVTFGKGRRKQRGRGILNDLISRNALPEMHLRGFSGKYSFAGPFTRLDQRLDKEGKPQPWSKPINDVDKSAYHHDLCYGQFTTTKDRNNICDKVMIEDMNDIIKNKRENWRTKADAYIVKGAISTKKFFGLGRKKRRRNRR